MLVSGPEYDAVVYDGRRYPIEVGNRTLTVRAYRYEAEEVAAEFAASVREAYLFRHSGLSADERDVVEEAVDGGYYESGTDDAIESVARRFRERRAVESDEWGGE